jgi:UDP-N-acetylglucosamine 2-epimerase
VLVYGDTNSTLAAALAAAKLHVPVAHVEAGLRSFNRRMPEEINRVVADQLSSLLFCPTETAVKNLAQEGITQGVHLVGDVMYDALCYHLQGAEQRSQILERLKVHPKDYLLATVHRAENTDQPENLTNIVRAFIELARSGQTVVFPVHPRTRKQLDPLAGHRHANLLMIAPVSYLAMLVLEKHAKVILTDSGGVQKEAYWLHVPCITLRDETEWVETLADGRNQLAGADTERIYTAALAALATPGVAPPVVHPGGAAAAILACLAQRQI